MLVKECKLSSTDPKNGFTLIEIMVVIIIIAVLASVAGPMISGVTDRGKKSATQAQLGNIKSAMVNYRGDTSFYPGCRGTPSDTGVQATMGWSQSTNTLFTNIRADGVSGKTQSGWAGPYMEDEPEVFMKDSWGQNFCYVVVKGTVIASGAFLLSAGPDGVWNTKYDGSTVISEDKSGYASAKWPEILNDDMSVVMFRRGG
ncbi:prepilin-type N-terminal cleavage/methylation domain-containing protein [Candidatus Riflebacteria bacterium]